MPVSLVRPVPRVVVIALVLLECSTCGRVPADVPEALALVQQRVKEVRTGQRSSTGSGADVEGPEDHDATGRQSEKKEKAVSSKLPDVEESVMAASRHKGHIASKQTSKKKKSVSHEKSVSHAKSKVTSDDASAHAPDARMVTAYGVALGFMVCCVTFMFRSMGMMVCFQVVLYVCCLAFIKIAMKIVFDCDFHYPKFVTSLHLLISSLAAFVVLNYRNWGSDKSLIIPTRSETMYGLLPIALTFGLSIGAENSALVFVSAAFSEVVASSNPVMSAFLTWSLGMDFNSWLVLPIMVVVAGCAISVSGEMHFSNMGLALLLLSVFCRGLKAVMQQKLMTGATKERFDPVTLMAWTCLFSWLELAIYSLATEGTAPMTTLVSAPNLPALSAALLASCVIACTLNISALFVIKQLGAVGMQMVSQMKSLLVVMGGVLLLSEPFTNMQKIGFVTILVGVYWYSDMKGKLSAPPKEKKEGKKEVK